MIRQRLRRSSAAPLTAACKWLGALSVAACATETLDAPPEDDGSGPASQAGASSSGGMITSAAGKGAAGNATGGAASGGSNGKAGSASFAGTAGVTSSAGTGGKASGGASTGGSGGTTAGAGGSANTAGKASGGSGASSGGSAASGAGSAMCDSGVAFCDDFEDRNANGWTKGGGTWTVVADGGDWVYEGGNGSEEAFAGDSAWTDQTVEANVKVTKFGGAGDSYRAGIMARHSGSSSFYVFALGGDGNLTLRKSTSTPSGASGTCGALPAGIDGKAWFTLKIVVSGAAGTVKIRTYLNGTLKHDCTTTSSTVASGQAGVLTYGSGTVAHFDDVSVTTP